jgi:hypothetical protein
MFVNISRFRAGVKCLIVCRNNGFVSNVLSAGGCSMYIVFLFVLCTVIFSHIWILAC